MLVFNYSLNNGLWNSCPAQQVIPGPLAARSSQQVPGVGVLSAGRGSRRLPPRIPKSERNVYMRRNNTSNISQPVTIRVKNEVAEYFKGKPLNKMVESLKEYMDNEQVEEVDGKLIVKGAFMVDKATVKDLELMGELCDMSFEEMFLELHRAIDDGEIDLVDGHFKYKKVGESQ